MLFIRVYFHPVLFQLRCQLCTPLTWGTTIRTNAERLFTIMIFNNVTGNYFHLKTDWTVAVLFPCDYWYFLSSVQSATSMREMISTAPFFFFLVLLRFLICCCVFGLLMCTYGPPGAFGRLLLSQNVRFDVDRPLDLANWCKLIPGQE